MNTYSSNFLNYIPETSSEAVAFQNYSRVPKRKNFKNPFPQILEKYTHEKFLLSESEVVRISLRALQTRILIKNVVRGCFVVVHKGSQFFLKHSIWILTIWVFLSCYQFYHIVFGPIVGQWVDQYCATPFKKYMIHVGFYHQPSVHSMSWYKVCLKHGVFFVFSCAEHFVRTAILRKLVIFVPAPAQPAVVFISNFFCSEGSQVAPEIPLNRGARRAATRAILENVFNNPL